MFGKEFFECEGSPMKKIHVKNILTKIILLSNYMILKNNIFMNIKDSAK